MDGLVKMKCVVEMLFVVVFVEEKEKGEECVGEIERK
jgi:hypothetical protein